MSGDAPSPRNVVKQFRRIGPLVLGLGTIAALSLASTGDSQMEGSLPFQPSPVLVETSTLPPPSPPRALYYEQTIAIVTFNGPNATMNDCELILAESNDLFDKEQLLESLSRQMALEQVSLATMISVVENCKLLQEGPTEEINTSYQPTNPADDKQEIFKLFRGILPGTLWCGFDDVAPNYRSLGPSWKLDRCCRAHDHCPVKVKPFQNRYGVRNIHPYTKVHCDCDDKFYNCLKAAADQKADAVGNFFFNLIGIQCIEEERRSCDKWASKSHDNSGEEQQQQPEVARSSRQRRHQHNRLLRKRSPLPPRERRTFAPKTKPRRLCEVYGAGGTAGPSGPLVPVPNKRRY